MNLVVVGGDGVKVSYEIGKRSLGLLHIVEGFNDILTIDKKVSPVWYTGLWAILPCHICVLTATSGRYHPHT